MCAHAVLKPSCRANCRQAASAQPVIQPTRKKEGDWRSCGMCWPIHPQLGGRTVWLPSLLNGVRPLPKDASRHHIGSLCSDTLAADSYVNRIMKTRLLNSSPKESVVAGGANLLGQGTNNSQHPQQSSRSFHTAALLQHCDGSCRWRLSVPRSRSCQHS